MSDFQNSSHVRVTDRGIESSQLLDQTVCGAQGESLYFDFTYHLTSPSVENSSSNMGGPPLIVL